MLAVATGAVYTDTSYYQRPLDATYEHGVVSFRAFDGSWEDPIFRTNLRVAASLVKANRLACVIVYLVYRPGTVAAQMAAFRAAVTAVLGEVPRWLCAEIDCESWGGRIRGDHSAELNGLYALLCSFLQGDPRRGKGYGNRPDLTAIWRTRPARMRVTLAHYGVLDTSFPGEIAQQYTDGQAQFAVAGLPSSTRPFGRCDHNIAHGVSPAQLAALLGAIITAKTPEELHMAAQQVVALDQTTLDRAGQANATWLVRRRLGGAGYSAPTRPGKLDGNLAELLVDMVNTQHGILQEAQAQTALLRAIADNTRPAGTPAGH